MPSETENKRREIIERFGAEGVITGARMFDEFRAMIIASLPTDLPEEEFKKQTIRKNLWRTDGRLPEWQGR